MSNTDELIEGLQSDTALKFLSLNTEEKTTHAEILGLPRRMLKEERHSRQVTLLTKPSTYNHLVALAGRCGVSVNYLINFILADFVKRNPA